MKHIFLTSASAAEMATCASYVALLPTDRPHAASAGTRLATLLDLSMSAAPDVAHQTCLAPPNSTPRPLLPSLSDAATHHVHVVVIRVHADHPTHLGHFVPLARMPDLKPRHPPRPPSGFRSRWPLRPVSEPALAPRRMVCPTRHPLPADQSLQPTRLLRCHTLGLGATQAYCQPSTCL